MPVPAFLRENAPWLTAGVLLTFLSSFGQTFFISIFAGHIRADFGLSHGQWGGIYTVGTFVSALAMVWAGGLTDRFRVRVLAPVILVLTALACLAMALNPVWWGLFFVIFALRFSGQGMTSHIAVVAMARWFIASRGKALSIVRFVYISLHPERFEREVIAEMLSPFESSGENLLWRRSVASSPT